MNAPHHPEPVSRLLPNLAMQEKAGHFGPEQRRALKDQMKKHPTVPKFTPKERKKLCAATGLSRTQIRTWEQTVKRMDETQRQAFLDKEQIKAALPKGHARVVYGTAFNTDRAFFERFLQFDGVPDKANLRSVLYAEAAIRVDVGESVFLLCFGSRVLLSTLHNYFVRLGAGSVTIECFGNARKSANEAARALYNIQNMVRIRGASEEGHFKHGTAPTQIAKKALRLAVVKMSNPNA